MKAHHEEIEEEEEEEQKKMEQEKVAAEAMGPDEVVLELQSHGALMLPVRVLLSIARRQRALKAVCNGRTTPWPRRRWPLRSS